MTQNLSSQQNLVYLEKFIFLLNLTLVFYIESEKFPHGKGTYLGIKPLLRNLVSKIQIRTVTY